MLGPKYYRLLNDLKSADVADAIGVNASLMGKLENDADFDHSTSHYLALCQIFGVSIEQLMKEYPDVPRKKAAKTTPTSQTIMTVYLRENRHTTRSLGDALGVSRQMVCNLCKMVELPEKYAVRLAALDGATVDETLKKYGRNTDGI